MYKRTPKHMDMGKLKVKSQKKLRHANTNGKKISGAILRIGKINFEGGGGKITRDKEIKDSI